ncbi:MAG: WecB/TagA/CpsF family glycosyltransferase [bacterium]
MTAGSQSPHRREGVEILNCRVDALPFSDALNAAESFALEGHFRLIVTLNTPMVLNARKDPGFREALDRADLVVPDGAGIEWASKKMRTPIPERVVGIDLMQEIFRLSERKGYRVYLLGADEETISRAVERLRATHPSLKIVGYHHGYFQDNPGVTREISEKSPHFLFVGMGSPKQEKWICENRHKLNCVCMGVGGSFDVIAGRVHRAPIWMRRAGLEWLYRALRQPRKLINLLRIPIFMLLVLADIRRSRRSHPSNP